MKMNLKILSLLIFMMVLGNLTLQSQDQNNFEISKNIEIYVDVLRQLNLNYADNIQPGDLNKTAIDALLGKLDPYTVYVPESQLEDFELMTRGEYGGIGALIQKQGEYVVISEPYEGFPAQKSGLLAGDKIIMVDGESAVGKNTSEVSEKLKGVPGTEIVITVERYGDTIQQDVTLLREKVKIPNIPYYGMLKDNVGYIRLSQFNPGSGAEVKKAFEELRSNDIKGIVIDLRGNGGGLLNEAVDITNIFVPKGVPIVTTKGKLSSSVHVHATRNTPVDTKIPLVVLVDQNSASASEIVAGAIQDLDRGVIVGERTFGKGLVQNIVPLPYNSKMKITVAKYYIPSGRCIQAIDYFDKETNNDRPDKIPDSLITAFKTKAGRTVYDGGGIEPDIKMEMREFSQITGDLYAQNYIFNYANGFVLENDSIAKADEFVISDEVFEDFKKWVENQEFDYKTETESLVERLNGSAEREGYLETIQPILTQLESDIKAEKTHDIERCRDEIEEFLKLEIVARYYYQKGRLIVALQNDPDVDKAIELISNTNVLNTILDGTYVKTENNTTN